MHVLSRIFHNYKNFFNVEVIMSGIFEDAFSERPMIVYEAYSQAAHDQIGFLEVRCALKLSQKTDTLEESRRFARDALKFIERYERLQAPSAYAEKERREIAEVREMMRKISIGEEGKVDFRYGLRLLDEITVPINRRVIRTRRDYDGIFHTARY
jgi:hypothetical protein